MKITIGSDHRGYDLKEKIIKHFTDIDWIDVGTNDKQRTDYPIYAKKACKNILDGTCQLGILICGSGVGMSIAANRLKGIYAALCLDEKLAHVAKSDDNVNVLALASDYINAEKSFSIIESWLSASFLGERYKERLDMIDTI